ncbi:glycosyltransferase family 4 protein [Flavobacterium faecale]|uniref:glycosyltransferase family 4 protein n=1 Tax=Flavobacterium faecale TaxID=1355330 RepID=UPI003AAA65E6
MKKIIRTATIALSLDFLLKGQLSFLNRYYDVIAISGDDCHLQEVHAREGVKTLPVEMHRSISVVKDLISLWKLYLVFKKEKPAIVHSITPKAGLLSMVAAKLAGVPIRMHTFTGLIFPSRTGIMKHLLIVMDKTLCYCATHIYPEGEGVKNDLEKYHITKKKLKVIANGNVNGIDLSYFDPRLISENERDSLKQILGIKATDFVFIFVGRLVGDKGINELISAFEQLSSENKNVKLLLVGPFESVLDPLKSETLQDITTNENIISVGFQKDIRPYLCISHCFVFPSYREGFPNVVMQAGAMGLPCIVTDINGCNEIIKEGVNGIIIPSKDIVSLYNGMIKIISEPDFKMQLISKSREMISNRFSQDIVWKGILNEYSKAENDV